MRVCIIEGCEGRHTARGYCTRHYLRLRKNGDPLRLVKVPAEVTIDLVLERGKVDQTGDCWIWNSTMRQGYGCIGVGGRGGKVWQAHRLMYELTSGPVPDGLILHHECHNRDCINPEHLSVISRSAHQRLHAAERRAA